MVMDFFPGPLFHEQIIFLHCVWKTVFAGYVSLNVNVFFFHGLKNVTQPIASLTSPRNQLNWDCDGGHSHCFSVFAGNQVSGTWDGGHSNDLSAFPINPEKDNWRNKMHTQTSSPPRTSQWVTDIEENVRHIPKVSEIIATEVKKWILRLQKNSDQKCSLRKKRNINIYKQNDQHS